MSDSNIVVGETFDVEVWVNSEGIGEELLSFGFDVDTPKTYFTYTGYTIGINFSDFSSGTNNVAGAAWTGITDNDVLLATLSFNAAAEGSDALTVFGDYLNTTNFYGLWYETSGFDINATTNITINPVPVPCTILLLCAGLPVIAAFRKRFRNG